jgi:hypothetical protein
MDFATEVAAYVLVPALLALLVVTGHARSIVQKEAMRRVVQSWRRAWPKRRHRR